MLKILLTATTMLIPAIASASIPTTRMSTQPAFGWQDHTQERQVLPHHRTRIYTSRHYKTRAAHHQSGAQPSASVARLKSELDALKREIADIRSEVGRPAWNGVKVPFFGALETDKTAREALSLPNLRIPPLAALPQEPLPAASLIGSEAVDKVREARAYLVRTATAGGTMVRQGVETAVERLHPVLAERLAQAIKLAREAGLKEAGVYSAYRPPAFHIGGFKDKFNSMHSYGLAVDMAGIGRPGSWMAKAWQRVVQSVGLFLPYGPYNHAEWNHTQLLPTKVASKSLRETITASAPKSLEKMWLASGVKPSVDLLSVVDFVAHK